MYSGMSAKNKAHRLLRAAHLLLWSSDGLSQTQLARQLGVARYQIYRDLSDMTELFPIYEDDTGRLRMNKVMFRRWWGKYSSMD